MTELTVYLLQLDLCQFSQALCSSCSVAPPSGAARKALPPRFGSASPVCLPVEDGGGDAAAVWGWSRGHDLHKKDPTRLDLKRKGFI